jgi:isocitrate/isopropylmalate dehydrogenase
VHGSAPDIVGVGVANPAGILRSVALLLDLALGKPEISDALDSAVDEAIVVAPTRDLGGRSSTTDFTDAVLTALPSKEEARVD